MSSNLVSCCSCFARHSLLPPAWRVSSLLRAASPQDHASLRRRLRRARQHLWPLWNRFGPQPLWAPPPEVGSTTRTVWVRVGMRPESPHASTSTENVVERYRRAIQWMLSGVHQADFSGALGTSLLPIASTAQLDKLPNERLSPINTFATREKSTCRRRLQRRFRGSGAVIGMPLNVFHLDAENSCQIF